VAEIYVAIRQDFTDSEKASLLCIRMAQNDRSWQSFREKVIGDTNPQFAEVGSLRRRVYDQWNQLQLIPRPDFGHNIVHVSTSALESLAERRIWLDLNPSDE